MTAFPKLDEVEGKLKQRNEKLHGIFEEAGADYDMSKVKSLDGDSKSKVDQIRALNEEIDSLGEERDSLLMLKSAAERARKAKDGGEEKPEFEDGADRKGKRDPLLDARREDLLDMPAARTSSTTCPPREMMEPLGIV